MGRLGFIGRIMLILMCALFALVLLSIGLARWQRAADTETSPRFPRVDQAAAILDLLRRVPSAERPLILRAANGSQLRVRIADARPADGEGLGRAPRVERLMKAYLAEPWADIEAYVAASALAQSPPRRAIEGRLMRVVAPLPAGDFVIIDAIGPRNALAIRVFGLPPGFWVGILGFAVAGLALFAALREARPLRGLTRALARFDGAAPDAAVPERGAPDIRRLIRAVNGMRERIATLLRERSFLIGAISHDLKTYLTRLRLRAEAIEDRDARERTTRDLDEMTALLDASLAFARGTAVTARTRLDIADLAAFEAAERAALGAPVEVVGDVGEPVMVDGDPVALRRVIANLVDNAVKFCRSRVEIRVEAGGGSCRIAVDDDGAGIADADSSAVFDPFYRAEGSRSRETGGAGLGLAIAKQIVEAHGGAIAAGGGSLGGARVIVTLPLSRAGGGAPHHERVKS